jgi:hypothetical protein
MEIAAANGAERNANESLSGSYCPLRERLEPEWLARLIEYRCTDHVVVGL